MATLDSLKRSLRQKAVTMGLDSTQPLSELQYSAGFDILLRDSGRRSYRDFVVPQLVLLLRPLFVLHDEISVLEIGPGSESVLESLPDSLKWKITRYVAFEPNGSFAATLNERLSQTSDSGFCLKSPPHIFRGSFTLYSNTVVSTGTNGIDSTEKFHVILFCHSMYGMKPKHDFIRQALKMLHKQSEREMVIVFHRDGVLFDHLICHRMASFHTGIVRIADDDESLDHFARFIAGFTMKDLDADKAIRTEWRRLCRASGGRDQLFPGHLYFSSPDIMAAFTQQATCLSVLTAQVPQLDAGYRAKNPTARLNHHAPVVRPTEIRHIQQCVLWALDHKVSLTVIGGGHSGHCLQPNVVAIDMGAFDRVHILDVERDVETSGKDSRPLILVEAGCKSGDVISKTMAIGLTVPLGARPSVGAGLWLQGGIGHLARLYGLACDAIVGAVVVSVASGDLLCVGHVPSLYKPTRAIQVDHKDDLLWGLRGAGTNFGIVISVTLKAYSAPTYLVRNWLVPISDRLEGLTKIRDFDDSIAKKLTRYCSADAYLYSHADKLCLGVTLIECTSYSSEPGPQSPSLVSPLLGPEQDKKTVNGIELFDTEMYMSVLHGGHGGGKTSSFKRCLFLKHIGAVATSDVMVKAIESRPTPFCYLHLLQGGGAVGDVADNASAFGCRDWDYACVVTGVWARDQDDSDVARTVVQWVYNVVEALLPLSKGAYGADLGPDPRDSVLAARAFGTNLLRLARLKERADPGHVLAHTCQLRKTSRRQQLLILVTGESCAGKDYCAHQWVSRLTRSHEGLKARAVSISDATKEEYAVANGADFERLLHDRAYKEQHRPMLSAYFQEQVRQRKSLPEEHFRRILYNASDTDVLLITGMRDEAPVATFSYLVPESRVLEVRVEASNEIRAVRRECQSADDDVDQDATVQNSYECPTLIFVNENNGGEAAIHFCDQFLLPFLDKQLQQLADMVQLVPNFPRQGIDFRHVLGISQQAGGLDLCTSLLQAHFTSDWTKISAVVCCETGGFVFASALAARTDVPLALIRKGGRLPPPTISAIKSPSHVSSTALSAPQAESIEISQYAVRRGASVVVVDDVLASGETLRAVLQLLQKAGVDASDTIVMVVAEFPAHRGRDFLCRSGFGRTKIQSLLVFGGA